MLSVAFVSILSAASAQATTSTVGGGAYRLVDEEGAMYVTLKPKVSSLFGFLAHQHVVEARGYSGRVEYQPDDPSGCRIQVEVPVAKLVVDRAELRSELGFEKGISEKDRKTVDKHMRAENQLHADRYDSIRFRSEDCEPLEGQPGVFSVTGELEIRGVRTQVGMPVEVSFDADGFTARAEFSEVHESFGFQPYSAFLGSVKNAPMLRFFVRVRGEPVE